MWGEGDDERMVSPDRSAGRKYITQQMDRRMDNTAGSCLFGCYRCTECFVVYILIFDMIRTQVIIKILTTRNSYCHTDLDTVIELLSNMLSLHHYLMMKMNL